MLHLETLLHLSKFHHRKFSVSVGAVITISLKLVLNNLNFFEIT